MRINRTNVVIWMTMIFPLAATGMANAGDTKLSGLMFGDYYYIAANHLDSLKSQNGFWIRRIYFTADQTISPDWDMRFRLEANSPDFSASATALTPFVKDAYLRWQHGLHSILIGISPSPTFDVIEGVWGFRAVEKTPLDLQKMASSREFGVAVKGAFDQAKTVRYHVMIGDGNGEKSETDKLKKFLGSLGFYPTSAVVLEGYADFEPRKGHFDRFTVQGFAAYRTEKYRIGAQLSHQSRQNGVDAQGHDNSNTDINVGSLFAAASVAPRFTVLGRVDRMFDPNPDAAKITYIPFAVNAKSTLFIGGVDCSPADNVHLIPNVEVVSYDKPKTDVIGRFTFSYEWK